MSKSITISLSDEAYEALRRVSDQAHQTAEEMAAAVITRDLGTSLPLPKEETPGVNKDRLLAVLRGRGLYIDPRTQPPHPLTALLPPRESADEAKLIDEIGEALSEALDRSGKSISDLVER